MTVMLRNEKWNEFLILKNWYLNASQLESQKTDRQSFAGKAPKRKSFTESDHKTHRECFSSIHLINDEIASENIWGHKNSTKKTNNLSVQKFTDGHISVGLQNFKIHWGLSRVHSKLGEWLALDWALCFSTLKKLILKPQQNMVTLFPSA